MSPRPLADSDFERLLAFRDGLRRFLKWSGDRARDVGLTPSHHQLLLIVRGHRGERGPTMGEIAEHLLVRHHSAVGIVDRAEKAGLVQRDSDPLDQRVVHVSLTEDGHDLLGQLSELHLAELDRLVPEIARLWAGLEEDRPTNGGEVPDRLPPPGRG